MKPSRVFWGVFLVALGTLLLLGRHYDLDLTLEYAWKFWPAGLILIGLAVIIKSPRFKWILALAAGLVTAFVVYGFFNFGWLHWHDDNYHDDEEGYNVQQFSEPLTPGIKRATFQLDAAAGKFSLDTTSKELLVATVNSRIGRYTLDRSSTNEIVSLHLSPEDDVHFRNWRPNRSMNTVEVKLNTIPVWEMKYEIGAATVDLDLSSLKVEELQIEAGAASVRLKLGMFPEETRVNLEAGASTVKLSIPEAAGCEIRMDGGLSSKRFEDFEKVDDNTYRTSNFEHAARKIYVNAETGVSSFRVSRY